VLLVSRFCPRHLGAQGVHPLLPDGPILAQPFIELLEWFEAEAVDPALHLPADRD